MTKKKNKMIETKNRKNQWDSLATLSFSCPVSNLVSMRHLAAHEVIDSQS